MPPRRARKPQAAKRRSGASRKGSGSPGWLWLLGGTALGAVIAVALYFHDQPRPERSAEDTQSKAPAADGGKPSSREDGERHFGDIFERLDDSKPKAVTAPQPTRPTRPAAPLTAPAHASKPPSSATTDSNVPPPVPPTTASKPPPKPKPQPKPSKSGPSWWLQAGAFRSAGQADSLKARLTLTGLPVKVVSGRGGNNILWYRVRVGPFASKQATNSARQRLKQQKISPVLVKQ